MNAQDTCKVQSQAGVSLLEVLIAVLILSVGLLGIAALQAITLKNSGSSAARTQASIQVYSMLDIIRANRSDVSGFNTNIYKKGSGTGAVGTMGGWLDNLALSVAPDAKGLVVCNDSTKTCKVGVQWDDSRGSGDKTALETQQVEITSQL